MSASLYTTLKQSKAKHLFEVKRHLQDTYSIMGFVVAFSDSHIMLHTLDMNTFRLNGYTVLRAQDISEHRVFAKAEYWQFRAVRHFHLKPIRPTDISVESLPELLKTVSRNYPLFTIHPEIKNPDVCYIGPLVSMTEHTFTIADLNSNGEWSGPRRIRFSDVTKVEFGTGYEAALTVTAPKKPAMRRK